MKYTNQVRRWSGPDDAITYTPRHAGDRLSMSSDTIWASARLGSSEVDALLREAIDGTYTVKYRLTPPHVSIIPSDSRTVLTVHATGRVRLKGGTRQLWGPGVGIDFNIYGDGEGLTLLEYGSVPAGQAIRPRQSPVSTTPRVSSRAPTSPPSVPTRPRQTVVVEEPATVACPDSEAPLPEGLHAIAGQVGLDRRQGDYLVVPEGYLPGVTLPYGVVRSNQVRQVHVVQPRLGVDTVIPEEP